MKNQWYWGILLLIGSSGSWSGGDDPVENARLDLKSRLEIPLEQIVIHSQKEKTWANSGLGCPRKGMKYKQVLTSGSQLILTAAGQHYYYHARAGKPYFYCAMPAKEKGSPIGNPLNET